MDLLKKLQSIKYATPLLALLITGTAGAIVYDVSTPPTTPINTNQPTALAAVTASPTASPDTIGAPQASNQPSNNVATPAAGEPTGTPAPVLPMYSHTPGTGYCLIRTGDYYIDYQGGGYYKGTDYTTNGCASLQTQAAQPAAPVPTPDPTPTPVPCDCNVTNPNSINVTNPN